MRSIVCSLALLTLASGCTPPGRRAADVVIIVVDTTRADRLGVYGHSRPTSPHIDRLGDEGVVFERAWSTASWTLPAHASLLTGQYPTAHGARITPLSDPDSNGDNPARLREDAVTLAELLSERSYRTAAFAGAGWLSPEFGLLQGYEVRDAVNNRTLPANAITDRALAWLDEIGHDEPIHLLVNYFDPHWPYTPPPRFDRFSSGHENVALPTLGELFSGAKARPDQLAKMLDLYDGEILFMDAHIGRLLDGLRARDRYDDTLIVLLADHGELIGEHGNLGHGAWLWEELTRIPLIVRFPGGRDAGTRSEALVSTVDVLSWIGEELGLELPDDVDGLSIGQRDLVLAEEFPNKIFASAGLGRNLVAGVRWPWKLIVSSQGDSELFHLERDPNERVAIDDSTAHSEIAQRIEATRTALVAPPIEAPRELSAEAREQLRELGYIE